MLPNLPQPSFIIVSLLCVNLFAIQSLHADQSVCPAYLNQEVQLLRSDETINLCDAFSGKPVLIINTASHCGFTPQFRGLETVHKNYEDRGLVVIGFPSNAFRQEAKTEEKTAEVCFVNYGVTFTMTAPTTVTGSRANPLFVELKNRTQQPSWNFNKYLLSADRSEVQHFGSSVDPSDAKFRRAIEAML